jgi:hypothetical protein
MQGDIPHISEVGPMWRRVDKHPPPKGMKLLFRTLNGPLVTGVWYAESQWAFWSPMPGHTPEDKEWIKAQSNSSNGSHD